MKSLARIRELRWLFIGIFVLYLIGVAISAAANPYLCSDPMTAEVVRVDVELNGQLIQVDRQDVVIASDGDWCYVDLAAVTDGSYSSRARANYGVWGDSAWSADFLFVKPAIVTPANTTLKAVP